MLVAAWFICLQANTAPVDKYSRDLFSWIGSLGYQDDLRKPFVRIDLVGHDVPKGSGTAGYGFLVADNPGSFDVLIPSLSVRTYDKGGCIYKSADFPLYVHEYLKSRRQYPEYTWPGGWWVGEGYQSGLAWVCRQRGMTAESEKLAEFGRLLIAGSEHLAKASAAQEEQYIAQGIYGDLISRFEDVRQSRGDLLTRFRSFASRFRETGAGKSASAVCDLLQQMVREDRKHESKPTVPLTNLTQDERAAELVWRLRNCHQSYTSSRLYSWADDSTEFELVDIGFPAVPQLLDALHDRRFTRTLQRSAGPPMEYGADRVIRVHDVAQSVLEKIARRDFNVPDWHDDAGVETLARAWWAAIKAEGERATLREAVRRGDANSGQQAERLVEAYPKDAFESIQAGIEIAKDPDAQTALVLALKPLHSAEVDLFVRLIADEDRQFKPRFAAAQVLANRDPDAAIAITEREWLNAPEATIDFDHQELITFLVESERPSAIRWMAKRLKTLNTWFRIQLLHGYFNGVENRYPFVFTRPPGQRKELSPDSKKELLTAIEELLGGELEDRERASAGINVGDVYLGSPEMSEVAEYSLAQCFAGTYKFAQPKSLLEKNRLRVKNLNVYRSRRGLAPEPMPAPPSVPRLPSSAVGLLIQKWLSGDATAYATLLSDGLSALPGVVEAVQSMGSPGRNRVMGLAQTLACTVRKVEVLNAMGAGEVDVREKAMAFQGSVLTTPRLFQILQIVALGVQKSQTREVTVTVERDTDGTGFVITVAFLRHVDSPGGWAMIDGKDGTNYSGGDASSYLDAAKPMPELAKAVDTAVGSGWDSSVEMEIQMVKGS